MVCPCFQSVKELDAPFKLFFDHRKGNGKKIGLFRFRGSLVSRQSASVVPEVEEILPTITKQSADMLDSDLSTDELHTYSSQRQEEWTHV